jgi:KaiC/GvpD/RAD55 family RecA-like ATPase
VERVRTGIPGLDALLEGGFPKPSSILLTGPPGAGKTIFGLQYLYKGVSEYNENGFMVKIEGFESDLQWYVERLGFDIPKYQKEGKLVITAYDPAEFAKFELRTLHSEIILQLRKIIQQIDAKRVVIDSVTPLGLSINDKANYRTLLYYISKALKEMGCTTIFVAEKMGDKTIGVEEYVMDGIIDLDFVSKEDSLMQTLLVKKMKATKFPIARYALDISDKGLQLATSF